MKVILDTNFVFDDSDERCLCLVSQAQGQLFAFIQCIDRSFDDEREVLQRYWGKFDPDYPEDSIAMIMRKGGKWPDLPR